MAKLVLAEMPQFRGDWAVEHCGVEALERKAGSRGRRRGDAFALDVLPDTAQAVVNDRSNLEFSGVLLS